jgi:4-diphosphocytidyl-2-C-methyl-D-erythritol kinase
VDRLTLTAPAKLNLRLLVGPAGPDGYHPIRSLLVARTGLSDTVTITRASERAVRCPGFDGPGNLAWHALDALERLTGRPVTCAVDIVKRIPARAGLGGGSSDAATTLRGANQVLELGFDDDALEAVAAHIGSDVPFFVRGGAQWATGRGELLAPTRAPGFVALIVMPPFGLSTADVYRAFDALPGPPPDDTVHAPEGMPALADWVRNDLWEAAASLRPELDHLAERLRDVGADAALLCGSGAAMAGLFSSSEAAHTGAAALGASLPGLRFWVTSPET